MNIFSERIRKLRKDKKLSQQQVADALNINRGSYSNWELGKREPDLDKIRELAKILGTNTGYLIGDTDNNYMSITLTPQQAQELFTDEFNKRLVTTKENLSIKKGIDIMEAIKKVEVSLLIDHMYFFWDIDDAENSEDIPNLFESDEMKRTDNNISNTLETTHSKSSETVDNK
ncbi:transcriptional regulator [Lactococcus garvieae]|uniref:helix-turn-helix domain-containing protein n=1 Tax=Lactococcus petauri TaxID=1940789 RepID=UPI0007DA35F6|nr:transcriptional regulator [Lactococcus garvieae]